MYGLFARTARASRLNQFLNSVADAGLELLRRGAARWDNRSLVELCHELLSSGGEARGTALARAIIERYLALGVEERETFLRQLAQTFGIVPERVVEAAELYVEDQTLDNLLGLAAAVESPNQELFRRINTAPQGTSSIVEMRRDLLHMKSSDPSLQALDSDLHHLLHSWFNRGFLTLRRIDWNTPAAILEQLIEYESVHAIAGWEDLRRRLAPDRRCFAFFHPALPDEPLIFVEVALLNELPGSIQPLLDLNSQRELTSPPRLAVFYSINNCHEGLRGVSFGNFLIKQVVLELKEEFETLNTFATLSPVPLFGSWLKNNVDTLPAPLIDEAERPQITNMTNGPGQVEAIAGLRSALLRCCAYYLVNAKTADREAFDPVARFHLRNGARLERINWMGDASQKGLAQSSGMLANYVYDLKRIEVNHEDYVMRHTIAVAPEVVRLIPKALR